MVCFMCPVCGYKECALMLDRCPNCGWSGGDGSENR